MSNSKPEDFMDYSDEDLIKAASSGQLERTEMQNMIDELANRLASSRNTCKTLMQQLSKF